MLKLRASYVNHNDENYAILSAAQALNLIYSCDATMDGFGDHISKIITLENGQVELYRNTEWENFKTFTDRLKELDGAFYEDVTGDFEAVEDDYILK
ncbi:TPA: hypothetical protein ACGORV_000993 [Streptococcus suis]